jgi:hypothetical protein
MLVVINDIRTKFRVETAVPDKVIQRELDYIDLVFTNRFGTTYTSVDPIQQPQITKILKTGIEYLCIARLLNENYVLTGFGVVRKKDEYSENLTDDERLLLARQYVKDASTILHQLQWNFMTDAIQDCQSVTEGFFNKRWV